MNRHHTEERWKLRFDDIGRGSKDSSIIEKVRTHSQSSPKEGWSVLALCRAFGKEPHYCMHAISGNSNSSFRG